MSTDYEFLRHMLGMSAQVIIASIGIIERNPDDQERVTKALSILRDTAEDLRKLAASDTAFQP